MSLTGLGQQLNIQLNDKENRCRLSTGFSHNRIFGFYRIAVFGAIKRLQREANDA